MRPRTSKQQAVVIVATSSLAVLVVMAGLLIVPRYAITVLTTAAIILGCGALLAVPGLVSTERHERRARGEGTGFGDGTALRCVCSECGWHWRAGSGPDACPRCGAPTESAPGPEGPSLAE